MNSVARGVGVEPTAARAKTSPRHQSQPPNGNLSESYDCHTILNGRWCTPRGSNPAADPYQRSRVHQTRRCAWHPQRDSNPCCRIESPVSLAARRWGLALRARERSRTSNLPALNRTPLPIGLHEHGAHGGTRTHNVLGVNEAPPPSRARVHGGSPGTRTLPFRFSDGRADPAGHLRAKT